MATGKASAYEIIYCTHAADHSVSRLKSRWLRDARDGCLLLAATAGTKEAREALIAASSASVRFKGSIRSIRGQLRSLLKSWEIGAN